MTGQRSIRLLKAVLLAMLVPSCADKGPSLTAEQRQACIEKGNVAAADLMTSLSTQLKAALASGGPEAAIRVCQQIAQPLTESTNQKLEGASIRRTSLKVRNPENAPDAIDLEVLTAWQALAEAGQALPEQELRPSEPGQVRYYKPIIVQELCLTCHGKNVDPKVQSVLSKSYPADQALGYEVGDLRGAMRVTVDLP